MAKTKWVSLGLFHPEIMKLWTLLTGDFGPTLYKRWRNRTFFFDDFNG